MDLKSLLEKEKAAISEKWFDLLLKTYAPDTAHFMKSKKDPFANPAGSAFSENLTHLIDGLINGADKKTVTKFLDPIIRVRAIQDFSPSQAVGFIFSLKKVIRKQLKKELKNKDILNELPAVESAIDGLGLCAFDIYMACREKIYSLKANDQKNKVYRTFKRAGLITEIADKDPDLMASNTL